MIFKTLLLIFNDRMSNSYYTKMIILQHCISKHLEECSLNGIKNHAI